MKAMRRIGRISAVWTKRAPFLLLGLGLALVPAGCESPQQSLGDDAQAVDPVRRDLDRLASAAALADEQRAQADARIIELQQQLAEQDTRAKQLEQRLADAEAELAELKSANINELATSLENADRELKQLKGDFVGLDYRLSQRFQDAELIHANLEQADEDLRKHVASSVTGLERRCASARDELEEKIGRRLDEERSSLVSSVRELERQTAADRARAALAMQSVRDALESERTAVSTHAQKLAEAVTALDARFGTEGDAARAQQAASAFEEARRLHQQYLDERHKPELLASAIDAYTRGLAIQPDAVDMHYELAQLLRVARRADDARPHLEYYLAHGQDPERAAQARNWLGGQ